ncbi:MAG: hypothetical protein K2K05_07550, partial [Muribaculaceae bacterium]|nr:hypothetical protein [Muribaculaceae bacterium]
MQSRTETYIRTGFFNCLIDTLSYCGPFEYENGALSRVNFPGGYVKDGVAYHYIHDHQGNVR